MSDFPTSVPQEDAVEQLRQVGEELADLRRELEHTQRLATLGTLAAGIAHEINNILTPVLAYAQLASHNPDDRQLQAKAMEKTIVGVETATQIAQAMLGFASTSDEGESANVQSVLQSALECIGRDPAKDQIKLTVNVHHDACVRMRPLALQQVLMNLILNARAVLRQRGGRLTISVDEVGNGTSAIRVIDSGPGIAADVVGRLFEPFASTRLASKRPGERSAKPAGTGLGLSICKRLVEDAGGTISASSTTGQGTTFAIILRTARMHRAKAS